MLATYAPPSRLTSSSTKTPAAPQRHHLGKQRFLKNKSRGNQNRKSLRFCVSLLGRLLPLRTREQFQRASDGTRCGLGHRDLSRFPTLPSPKRGRGSKAMDVPRRTESDVKLNLQVRLSYPTTFTLCFHPIFHSVSYSHCHRIQNFPPQQAEESPILAGAEPSNRLSSALNLQASSARLSSIAPRTSAQRTSKLDIKEHSVNVARSSQMLQRRSCEMKIPPFFTSADYVAMFIALVLAPLAFILYIFCTTLLLPPLALLAAYQYFLSPPLARIQRKTISFCVIYTLFAVSFLPSICVSAVWLVVLHSSVRLSKISAST